MRPRKNRIFMNRPFPISPHPHNASLGSSQGPGQPSVLKPSRPNEPQSSPKPYAPQASPSSNIRELREAVGLGFGAEKEAGLRVSAGFLQM